MQDDVIPLVICDNDGRFLGLAMSNEKGWKKTLENGEVWALHPDSKRLLPEKKWGRVSDLVAHRTWCRVTVASTDADLLRAEKPSEDRSNHELQFLVDCIRDRKTSSREGSYTQYLFREGPEKIRKKLAEEAIEVVLADRTRVSSEAADLLYHLLVLLEYEELSFDAVLAELLRRMEGDS